MATEVKIIINAIDNASGKLKSVGMSLTKFVSLPLAGLGVASLKAFKDWETAFAGVRKTVNATESQFQQLSKGIRQMSKEIPASTTEIARVAEAAGQLGIKTENIMGFTRTMVDLGVATNMASEDAATALARLANITQLPQGNFDRLGATIVDLGNNLATTESEIVEMGLRLAGAGHQVGMTEAQILSFAGALSSVGVEAQMGGSAISRVMVDIASSVATGDESLQKFAQVAGVSTKEFQKAFKEDAASAIVSFIEGLHRISEEGGNVFGVLDDLGLGEIRVRDALLRAAGAGDLFRSSLELGSKAWEENTALTEEAKRRYETFESQLSILWNKIKDVAITLGGSLAPMLLAVFDALDPVIQLITKLAEWFAQLPKPIQTTIAAFALLLAGIGPLLTVLGGLLSAIGFLTPAILALGVVGGPVLLAVAAFAALVAGGILLYKNWDVVKEKTIALGKAIKEWLFDKFNFVVEGIEKNINKVKNFFGGLYDYVVGHSVVPDLVDEVINEFGRMGEESESKFELLETGIRGTTDKIKKSLKEVSDYGKSVSNSMVEANKKDLESLSKAHRDWEQEELNYNTGFLDTLLNNFEDYAKRRGGIEKQLGELSYNILQSITQGFANSFARSIVYAESFSDAMDNIWKEVAATAIAAIVRIATEWAILQGIMGINMGYPGMASLAGSSVISAVASLGLGAAGAAGGYLAGGSSTGSAIGSIGGAIGGGFLGNWLIGGAAGGPIGALIGGLAGGFLGGLFGEGGIIRGGLHPITSAANGLVTAGPMLAMIGDNPSGQEAVVPLKNGAIPVELSGNNNGGVYIKELNVMPNASIDEALMNKPVSWWMGVIKQKILPAMNILGNQGYSTSLKLKEGRI